MVIRLSNKIGLKTLFMKEGEAAEGIVESLKKATYLCKHGQLQKRLWPLGEQVFLLASHANPACQGQLQGVHS